MMPIGGQWELPPLLLLLLLPPPLQITHSLHTATTNITATTTTFSICVTSLAFSSYSRWGWVAEMWTSADNWSRFTGQIPSLSPIPPWHSLQLLQDMLLVCATPNWDNTDNVKTVTNLRGVFHGRFPGDSRSASFLLVFFLHLIERRTFGHRIFTGRMSFPSPKPIVSQHWR